ncbi:hypothetical protein [Candidatus Carsonella ruddii]|uniref:hypothetical protein n=1 Tax=Carsonella ruddii TaxID=114186 RepID=UPI003D4473F4
MINNKIKEKIFNKKNKIILKKNNLKIKFKFLIKKKLNIKLINIFYKKKLFFNNKKNNISYLTLFFIKKNLNLFIIKNLINFRKKKNINNFFKFFKKIINCFFNLRLGGSLFYKNFKISKLIKKRFFRKNISNLENPFFFECSYYFCLNYFLIKKNINFIILKKNVNFNKIICYNNILLLKIV